MKNNKTEIVFVVDRSGSMFSIRQDMEGGLKEFLAEQKKLDGEFYVTHYEFDSEFSKVFENKNIQDLDSISIDPRGGTALIDAIGFAIKGVGERLANTAEEDRPSKVIFSVVTDGEENSSVEYTADQIREMIKEQEGKYNWDFMFLGANIDAVATGTSYGFDAGKSMDFGISSSEIHGASVAMSAYVSNTRFGYSASFSDEDRKAAKSE